MTEWRPIAGYEGRYEISDDGQAKALAAPGRGRPNKDRILKLGKNANSYHQVLLYPGGGSRYVAKRVHILILETFIGPRPEGLHGLHNDDDRDNNHLTNLRWGTRSENSYDMVANGNHNHARKTHCKWGHPFSGDNLIVTPRQRFCRECKRRRQAAYDHRRALAVLTADTVAERVA